MAEVASRIRFEDPQLHKPEFLDIHEVLQAASHPSVEQFERFVRLVEVAQEQAPGIGESDLRRLKRQFASLKNTFMLYDVKQSFFEGLAEGFPDGTEGGQIREFEAEVEKQGTEVKKLKSRNEQMRAELSSLIESTSSAFKDFSQQKADIASHLECLSIELAEQDKSILEPLPALPEGPDVDVCKALLESEARRTRELEDSIASQQAVLAELQSAIAMEEHDLHNLESQIAELEAKDVEEVTQDLMARYVDSAEWCDEIIKLTSELTGISVASMSPGQLDLQLIVSFADGTTSSPFKLSLWIDSRRGLVSKVALQPPELELHDVVDQDGCQVSQISSLVLEVQARLADHFAQLCGQK